MTTTQDQRLEAAGSGDTREDGESDDEAARRRMIERNQGAWKTPVPTAPPPAAPARSAPSGDRREDADEDASAVARRRMVERNRGAWNQGASPEHGALPPATLDRSSGTLTFPNAASRPSFERASR